MSTNKSNDHSKSGLFNQSLEKGLDILLAFGPDTRTMNLSEIAKATGISRSAAQRFTYTLEALGYLQKHPVNKRYSLRVSTLALGYRYLLVNQDLARANPFLRDLNVTCGETVNYSEPDGSDMVYVGRFPTTRLTPVHMPLGRTLPMYCTSAGRAYLACLPAGQRKEILMESERVSYTNTTVTDINELLYLCDEAAEVGYAYANGEYYQGDMNVSAAVLNASGVPIGVVSISAPETRWSLDQLRRQLAPLVMETSRLISVREPSPAELEPFVLGAGKISPSGGRFYVI
ncbi:IclR family transcriptional regulator [Paenalcaligenes niemegkensis]|uniref:IclR family transcriptional regulator n=1 Tax=Paenalcaligenes niemegkensis TaxID=2895469 RepID=UPI001EE87433|nr:IclR family transcriptional regulator [Paenalcaligenes niemegkensis]MCQ9617441.1 IclR family transcriptional regulator [Paenalcaligenes niemegkensis]